MTNDELKKKIVDTIMQIKGYSILQAEQLADALITAGIGDVKEVERCAEVAERALRRACEVNAICAEADVPNILSESSLYRFYLEQAEKELAEEGEDD